MVDDDARLLREMHRLLAPTLDEASLRLWAGAEARVRGRGGITRVARATGLARNTVLAGVRDLVDPDVAAQRAAGRIRRPGAGRKPVTATQPDLRAALDRLVAPATRGDPESPLRWTSKSLTKLATALHAEGFVVGRDAIAGLLKDQGYSLQAPRKTHEGGKHPDRDAQFQHLATQTLTMQAAGQPVISVDCKKKERVGEFKNGGREWQPAGKPEAVNVYDFIDDALFKVSPYGIYDVTRNEGWVNVGIDHDTAEFAAGSIRPWWRCMGRARYPGATALYITADGGGSNGSRNRLWKHQLQAFADATGLTLHVSHLPPGTSKWNKIEHRLFSQITLNWRGKPLTTLETVVSLIANTRTEAGLTVRARADLKTYRKGRKISDAMMKALALTRDDFHGEWNYTLSPRAEAMEN